MTATVHENLPFDRYVQLPGESASGLRDFIVSPLLYRWRRDHPKPQTDAMVTGRATHTAILEPHRFSSDYVLWDGNARRGKDWDAFRLQHEPFGRTILTENQRDTAVAVAKAVRSHPIAGAILAEAGRAELSITWTHARTGTPMKARIDWLCSALVDLKTSRDVEPRLFSGQVARLGYHVQMAIYRAALLQLGVDVPTKLVTAQNIEPYDVAVYSIPEDVILVGEQAYEQALDRLALCRSRGEWPGIAHDEELELHLPTWAIDDEDLEWEVTVKDVA